MLANDKIGQTPAEFDNVIKNNFKCFWGMNINKGRKFFLKNTTKQNSNLLEDALVCFPLVLLHVTKLCLSKILSAHKMIIFQDSTDL